MAEAQVHVRFDPCWRTLRRVAALGLMLAWPMPPLAAEPFNARERAEILGTVEAWSERDFAVPDSLKADVAMRTRVEALAREHRQHIKTIAEQWLKELASTPNLRPMDAVAARYFNESVAWQVDRLDDADDARLLRGLEMPGLCATVTAYGAFQRWGSTLPFLSSEEQDQALQAQATLLARWGQPRASLPQRPETPWLKPAIEALRRLRLQERPADEPAAPPVLLWAAQDTPHNRFAPDVRCALLRWTLQRPPLRDASQAERARQARFALAFDVALEFKPITGTEAPGAYPAIAAAFMVEGRVRVEGRARASGVGLDNPVIMRRQITMEGLNVGRPIAFEHLLDEASLKQAETAKTAGKAPGAPAELEVVWRLN